MFRNGNALEEIESNTTNSIENRSLPSLPRAFSQSVDIMKQLGKEITKNNQGKDESFITPSNILFRSEAPISQYNVAHRSSIASDVSDNITNLCSKLQQMHSVMQFRGSRDRVSGYSRLESSNEEFHDLEEIRSVILPKLQPKEDEFMQLVKSDNVKDVENFLKKYSTFNVNCSNHQGVSALHIAVHNRSETMVECLLKQPNIEIGDTILQAALDNNTTILLTLLKAQKKVSPGLEFAGATHSTLFPEHLTPLAAAAQAGHYEAVALLVSRGHSVPLPHLPFCACNDCSNPTVQGDPLYTNRARLTLYHAYSSPVYLVHVCADPILAAFRLAAELEQNAAVYRHFYDAYMKLKEDVSNFAVDLIGCCRTSEEVEMLLKQTSGLSGRRYELPRLLLAIDYKQKEFVAHPNTQQVLESFWFGDMNWHGKSFIMKTVTFLMRVPITPLILIMSMIAPWHSIVRQWQIPLNKLITHIVAYIVFLALVFFISNQDKKHQKRGPPNTGMEGLLVLYVCGYVWSSFRKCVVQGARRYFTKMWNWAEIIMLMLYLFTFNLWYKAAADVGIYENADKERKYWNQYDPTLLAEGTFCLATIIAFLRVMLLCHLSHQLGPLQVSLGKMTSDIYKYIIVYTIILSAFAAGLSRFYQYYKGMVHQDINGMNNVQVSSFTSISDTLYTLFWALFCMAPLESANVVLDNTDSIYSTANHHGFTQKIGHFCFGTFEVISVIVVLNMLIATMSNTFQKVNDNAAIEWTFARTEVYLEYMRQTTLPSPYNLVPTAAGIANIFDWCRYKIFAKPGVRAKCSLAYCCYLERDLEANLQKEYPALMSVLVQRYFRSKGKPRDVTLEVLQREIAVLRNVIEGKDSS